MPTDTLTQSLAQSLLSELLKVSSAVGNLSEHSRHLDQESQSASRRLDRLELHQSELSFEMRTLRASMRPQGPAPAPTTPSRPAKGKDTLARHGRRFLPKILGWLGEKLLNLGFQYLAPLAWSLWLLIHQYGQGLWTLLRTTLKVVGL